MLQLATLLQGNNKGLLNAFKFNKKNHLTIKQKTFVPLYMDHLHFFIKRAGWIVTKIYAHYTFEQSNFKKDFVVMNQVSRQNAKTYVGKDFRKLMNNTNFDYDCRSYIDNCKFTFTMKLKRSLIYKNMFHCFSTKPIKILPAQ